jgi:divalent metal cation (Fe/Co/Zn/Cd) transporter
LSDFQAKVNNQTAEHIVSLALMAAALGIIYEGIREITAPSGTPAPYTLVVLAGVLVIKEVWTSAMFARWDSVSTWNVTLL